MHSIPSTVPAPWTPINVTHNADAIQLDIQGRSYTFGNEAALPTRIQTKGVDILAAPIRLVGKIDGEPVVWHEPYVALLGHDDAQATITGAIGTEGFSVGNTVNIGFDGAIRFDTTIAPWILKSHKSKAEQMQQLDKLEALWLEIPLHAKYASLFTWWPLDPHHANTATQLPNSGAIPAEGLALPFKPFIWLGWQDGGLSWFCESAKSWQPQDKNSTIEVVRDGDTVTLRLHLLDGVPETWRGNMDGWFHPNAPITFSWGLQATPVKPLEENVLKYRIVHFNLNEQLTSYRIEQETYKDTKQTVLDRAIEAGANVVILHEQWNSIQNYWVNPNADEIKATVAACHARGIKILPYFGYELSTLAPEWAKFHDKVLVKNADGWFFGGWKRLPPQRDYIVCYASEWQDKWLAGIEWMIEEYGFDGVYLDGTSMPWACANESHDCGYEENGKRHETYPIWEVRRLYQRLYDIVSMRDGIITTHQSSCCVTPTLAYSHTYLDGEHISGLKPNENDEFPFATFQAEFMGRPFGIQAEFLSNQPEALAYALIHNVLVRPNIDESLDLVASIWRAFTEFGTPEATWLPYWKNTVFVPEDAPHVRVSAYLREGKVLLLVANVSATENVNVAIRITPDNRHEFSTARDIISEEILSLDNGIIHSSYNAMGWRMVELKI